MHQPLLAYSQQRGTVLVIGLILILVASIVTLASMRSGLLQERMAANQNFNTIAFLAAETGATSFIHWLEEDPKAHWGTSTWQSKLPHQATQAPNVGQLGYFWISSNEVHWSDSQVRVKIQGHTKVHTTVIASAQLRLTLSKPNWGPDPIFSSGIVAQGNLRINGNAQLIGNAHTNGDFRISGGNSTVTNGQLSAHGQMQLNNINEAFINPQADKVTIPRVNHEFLTKMADVATTHHCDLNLSGDQNGQVYYCNGNTKIQGNFSNATIVSTGDITQNGATTLGGANKASDAITVAIIAQGDITFNGADVHAVFWNNGNYRHNGSGRVIGNIISGGNITRNGQYQFEQNQQIDNAFLPQHHSPMRILKWSEVFT